MASCRISYNDQGVATVVDEAGNPSKLYNRIIDTVKDQKEAINIWSAAMHPDYGLDGELTTLEDLTKFMDSKAASEMNLTPEETLLVKDIMSRNGFSTLSDMHEVLIKLFKPEGIISLPERDTSQKNLYTQEDLRNVDLVSINNLLQKMEGFLMRDQDLYVAPQEQTELYTDTSRKNALGMSERLTQEEVSSQILGKIKDFSNESEIENVIKESPFSTFSEKFLNNNSFRKQVLNDFKDLRRIPTLSIVAGQLTAENLTQYTTIKNTILSRASTTAIEAEMEYLASINDFVWRANPNIAKGVLKEIEKELIKLNLDVIGISEHTGAKEVILDILNEAFQMLKNPTHNNIKSFSDKIQVLIPQPDNSIVELVDERYKAYNIVHVEAFSSEADLFNSYGLIKIDENMYHKVDQNADIDTLVDFIAKKYVEGEFELPKEFQLTRDLTNKESVLEDVATFIASQQEMEGLANKMLYTAYKKIFGHEAQAPQLEQVSNLTTIKTNEGYLKSDFTSDFYRYILEEKAKDSQVYRSVLSHFYISDKDTSLKGRPATIKGIKFEQELSDYIKLKRGDQMRYLIEDTASPFILEDLVAVNFPETVVEIDEEYMMHGTAHTVLPSTARNYIKIDNKLFRKSLSSLDSDVFSLVVTQPNPVYFTTNTNFSININEVSRVLNNHPVIETPVELGAESDPLVETKITINNVLKPAINELGNKKIRGRLLNDEQSIELQKEIESKYTPEGGVRFGSNNTDIRNNLFNYDNPLAQKISNGVDIRITEGLIRGKEKTYLLYADGKIAGEFYSVADAKSVVKIIEENLVSVTGIEQKQPMFGQNKNVADYTTVLDSQIKLVNLYSSAEGSDIVNKIDECSG